MSCAEPEAPVFPPFNHVCNSSGAIDTATITQGVVGFAVTRDADGGCHPFPATFDFVPMGAVEVAPEEVYATWTSIETGSLRPIRVEIGPEKPTFQVGLPAGPYAVFWNPGNHVVAWVFRLPSENLIVVFLNGLPSGHDGEFRLGISGDNLDGRPFVIDDGAVKGG